MATFFSVLLGSMALGQVLYRFIEILKEGSILKYVIRLLTLLACSSCHCFHGGINRSGQDAAGYEIIKDKFEACIPHKETMLVSQQNEQEEITEH